MIAFLVAAIAFSQLADRAHGDAAQAPATPSPRTAWTTSHITGSPEAPLPYQTRQAFPKLRFTNPLDIAFADGSDRVFVAEQGGKIYSFRNDESIDKPDLFADLPGTIKNFDKVPFASGVGSTYGFAFHPHFREHRSVYICYVLNMSAPAGEKLTPKNSQGTRVSKFDVTDTDPPRIDPASEKILLTWFAGGHNAGCVKFGPDGYLYVSSGDGGDPDPPDPFNTGQDISDLLSSVLRIDVDHADGDKAYSIPADNPFVHTPGARPEVYAYGLRNPWRFSFDSASGNLWAGDVGWELFESVQCVKSGGNYGWSIMEGPNPVHPDGTRGPTPITPPMFSLDHTEAASLTGGLVYHGKKLPGLSGYYVFGDWQTSRLWAAKCEGDKLQPYRTIARTDQRIVAFGETPDHELLIVDHQGGGLWRIVPNEAPDTSKTFPRKLSDTGLFSSVKDQTPAPGVLPFAINAPQWVDGATARRWIAVPGTANVSWGKGVWGDEKIAWPKDSVLVRTLSIEFASLGPDKEKPVETQVLHFDGKAWNAYTYAWNADHTDAELIDAEGDQRSITVPDMQDMTRNLPLHDGVKQRPWHFASRAQCMTCHNVWDDYALAFNAPQLDRAKKSGDGAATNQADTFRKIGLLIDPHTKPDDASQRAALTDPYNPSGDLNERARSYLHVNCSVCHRFGGGGSALFDVRKELPPAKLNLIDARPNLGAFGLDDARIVCPGRPERSVMLYRMAKLGRGRMPHIGSDEVDHRGLQLIMEWIRSLAPAGQAEAADPARFQDPATVDRLLTTPTGALAVICAIHSTAFQPDAYNMVTSKGLATTNETVHDLFRTFDPAELNRLRLGPNINPTKLLALHGDAARGRTVFHTLAGGLCARCHKVDNEGNDFGPDLSHIATKYNRADLLDNILNPSKTIAPGYATYIARTKTGDTFSGLLVKKTATEIVLKDLQLKEIHLATADVDRFVPQTLSAMPEGLLADLDPQQAADLLEYLATHK